MSHRLYSRQHATDHAPPPTAAAWSRLILTLAMVFTVTAYLVIKIADALHLERSF